MRFIGVLRNAAKTGDEYPNGDRARGEGKRKREGRENGLGYHGIDRRKGEIRPPPPLPEPFSCERVRLELLSRDIFEECISCSLRTNSYYLISLEFLLRRLY